MDFIKTLPNKSVDLVVTDPPYLIETDGAGFFGKKSDSYSSDCKGKKENTWGYPSIYIVTSLLQEVTKE
jgi:DNA modification methylase